MGANSFRQRSSTSASTPKERTSLARGSDVTRAGVYDVEVIEPGVVATRQVPIDKVGFQRTLEQLARDVRLDGTPKEAARELLKVHPELEGEWVAEVYRDRVLTLVPLDAAGPVSPEAEDALRRDYSRWCEKRGGGDCLHLFDDGPFLRTDDRRMLALSLAFGSVLDEMREALGRELSPRALVAMIVWTVGLYLGMWLVPEPTTKAAAAALTVMLVAWLGVDTMWGLMDGWVQMATRAHDATTFADLRAAGEGYAKVLGTDATRALILAVATLTGRTLGEVAARVRSLPGYNLAAAQWDAQGGVAVLGRAQAADVVVVSGKSLAAAVEVVEAVVASPQGALAVTMLGQGAGGGGASVVPPGGSTVTVTVHHRAGNQHVLLGNGQRWHLPRGRSPRDIPTVDEVGDELQEAANRAAREWGPDKFTPAVDKAIKRALEQGRQWLAHLLEREARGRYVEDEVRKKFQALRWNDTGVDVMDLSTGRQYEILSGTESNIALHGRRLASELFRMITF